MKNRILLENYYLHRSDDPRGQCQDLDQSQSRRSTNPTRGRRIDDGRAEEEAREGLENAAIVIDVLEKIYQMDVTHLSPADVGAFRDKTRSTYNKWADDIGVELVRSTEKIVERTK
jgi:hypothetical protein